MKKVLLTTTALVLTAGVASAEITFSGNGEAGFHRTAKVKAAKPTLKAGAETQNLELNNAAATVANTALAGSTIVLADSGTAATQTDVDNLVAALKTKKDLLAASTGADAATLVEIIHDIEEIELQLAKISTGSTVAEAKAGDLKSYSGYDFNVAVSGASDNGMTFAMGFDMGAGSIADQDDDRALDAQAGAIDTSALTIGYAGYTVVIGDEKVDDLYDADGWNADVSVSGSFGDLTFAIATDMDKDVAATAAVQNSYTSTNTAIVAAGVDIDDANNTFNSYKAGSAAVAAVYNPTSYSIGYTMGDMSFSMAGTDHDQFGNSAAKYSLTYALLPSLSATLSSDNLGTYKDVGKLSATYTVSDAMSITASVKDDKDHALNTNKGGKQSNDFSIAYSAGAMSATVATDESSNWWVNAKYDLGGGATAFTTFDHSEFLVAGVNFAF